MFEALNITHYITSLLLLFSISHAQEGCTGPRNVAELADTLWGEQSQYKQMKYVRPNVSKLEQSNKTANPAHADADNANLQMHVLSVKNVNQQREDMEMVVYLREQWNDFRLKFNTESDGGCFLDNEMIGFDTDVIDSIWTPHVVLSNLADEEVKMASSLWIYPNGDVVYTEFLLLKTSCQLDLKKFPGDVQTCSIVVGSLRDDIHEVKLGLMEPAITKVSIEEELGTSSSAEWEITDIWAKTHTNTKLQSLQLAIFTLKLKRNLMYYNYFVIYPIVIMVIISWSSFFIDRAAAPARVTMSIISFLAIANFTSRQFDTLPRVGGNDALLLTFMFISMAFSFYSVIEYVICNYLWRVEKRTSMLYQQALKARTERLVKRQEKLERRLSGFMTECIEITSSELSTDIDSDETALVKEVIINKKHMEKYGELCQIDRILLGKDGKLLIKDEHVEVFSRWMYPITYIITICTLYIL